MAAWMWKGDGRRWKGRKEEKRRDEMSGTGPTLQRHIPSDVPPPDRDHLLISHVVQAHQ